jgi:hypothetical protein
LKRFDKKELIYFRKKLFSKLRKGRESLSGTTSTVFRLAINQAVPADIMILSSATKD